MKICSLIIDFFPHLLIFYKHCVNQNTSIFFFFEKVPLRRPAHQILMSLYNDKHKIGAMHKWNMSHSVTSQIFYTRKTNLLMNKVGLLGIIFWSPSSQGHWSLVIPRMLKILKTILVILNRHWNKMAVNPRTF